jgi:hypothetical protein
MNGTIMWFFWTAFCDACLRLSANQASIPAEFWTGLGRCILLGLINDGLIRHRFPVSGFSADEAGQKKALEYVQQLPEAQLVGEFASRFRASGLGTGSAGSSSSGSGPAHPAT